MGDMDLLSEIIIDIAYVYKMEENLWKEVTEKIRMLKRIILLKIKINKIIILFNNHLI